MSSAHTRFALVVLLLVTAGLWMCWLGWDVQRDVDPVSGLTTGPWQAWQVGGLALCLASTAVVAIRWLHPVVVILSLSLAITALFSVTGALDPAGDGLWGVGAAMVLLGMLGGVCLIVIPSDAYWRRRPVG